MGTSATHVYRHGSWHGAPEGEEWLSVDLYDSDYATIEFSPAPRPGTGKFYLGIQPRDYWEDPDASADVDNDREATAFVEWAEQFLHVQVRADDLVALMAEEGVEDPIDTFAGETVERLLALLGLPVPENWTV